MKMRLIGAGLLLATALAAAETTELRTWTSSVGTSMRAKFISASGGLVKLQKEDETVLEVPLKMLSEEDQKLVRTIAPNSIETSKAVPSPTKARGVRELPQAPADLDTPALKKLPVPTVASEAEIRKYIRRVLVFATELDFNDQIARRELTLVVSNFGSSNLDIVLDEINRVIAARDDNGSPLVPFGVSGAIEPALVALSTDENKALVIAAFAKNISLAGLIKQKRWDEDAAESLAAHLRSYRPYGGYGRQDVDMIMLAASSRNPKVREALLGLLAKPKTEYLLDFAVRSQTNGKPDPDFIRQLWAKQRGARPSLELAAAAMEIGEITALEIVAKYLRTFDDAALKGATDDTRLAKHYAKRMKSVTDAPPGNPAETAAWILARLSKLKWDGSTKTYTE
jgi:SLA1 homology domain 1, SHD1